MIHKRQAPPDHVPHRHTRNTLAADRVSAGLAGVAAFGDRPAVPTSTRDNATGYRYPDRSSWLAAQVRICTKPSSGPKSAVSPFVILDGKIFSSGRVGENHECQWRPDRPVAVFRQDPAAGRQRPCLDSARRFPDLGLATSNPARVHDMLRDCAFGGMRIRCARVPLACSATLHLRPRESAPSSEQHSSWTTTGTAAQPAPESPRCSVLSRAAALLMIFAADQQSGQLSQNQSVSFGRTSLMVLPQSAVNSAPSSR